MLSDKDLFKRLQTILDHGPYTFPEEGPFKGTGRPGIFLEHLLELKASNRDIPDSGSWELKFHSGASLLTLLHLTPKPGGIMKRMVLCFGSEDKNGNIAFRHTIGGKSAKGFYVVSEDGKIVVKHDNQPSLQPYWTHDKLIERFASKLRRLIVVYGTVSNKFNSVTYEHAFLFSDPSMTKILENIVNGTIKIDFDARTTPTGHGLRDHGTKLRIKGSDLEKLYQDVKVFS